MGIEVYFLFNYFLKNSNNFAVQNITILIRQLWALQAFMNGIKEWNI